MIHYRPEIDGLRAVSILPVVAYHAGIAAIPGGFIGVDVFFVISGYLIGAIILSDIAADRFSILGFYERRVRRILPALLTMLAAVSLAAFLFMLPNEFAPFPPSLIATLLFGSNILFWRRSGYFAPDSEMEALLHGWSIGVEEQFYLLAPLLLLSLRRFAPRALLGWLIALTLASFALCAAATFVRPAAAFYLLPARAWELSAGIALAVLPLSGLRAGRDALLAGGGLVAIFAAAFSFSSAMAYPGFAALLPVAGAALVIRFAAGNVVGRALAWPPLVFVGLISYSLYLWHWPLIVFGRLLGLLDGSALATACVIILSLVIAILSWRYVERPFRRRGGIGRRPLFVVTGGVTMLLLLFGFVALSRGGWPERWSAQALAMDSGRLDFSPNRACHRDGGVSPIARSCVLGGREAAIAVWGDSHGVEIASALAQTGRPVMAITYSSCPPALGVEPPERPQCGAHNRLTLDYLEREPAIGVVLLAMKWDHWGGSPGFWPGLAETIRRLRRAGKTVWLMGPTPAPGGDLPSRLARGGRADFPRAEFEARLARPLRALRRLEADVPIFWPDRHLCAGERCTLLIDGAPLLFDDHHLSMTAARYLARRFPELSAGGSRRP